jgi:hypothetical protein
VEEGEERAGVLGPLGVPDGGDDPLDGFDVRDAGRGACVHADDGATSSAVEIKGGF